MTARFRLFRASPLARRLMIWTVLFSSLITLFLTALQLYRDYRADIAQIQNQLTQIEQIHLATIAESLWATDATRLQLHLEGMLRVRDMHFLELREGDEVWARTGQITSDNVIRRDIPIEYTFDNQNQHLGTLTVVASLDGVYERLLEKALTILISNAVKTFLVALFILALFHRLVTRHLVAFGNFADNITQHWPGEPIQLKRVARPDELSSTATALNAMRDRLQATITALSQSESRFRATFERAAVGIAHIAPSGRWLMVNQRLCDILGYRREQLLRLRFQDITFADDLAIDLDHTQRMLRGEIAMYSREKRYRHRNGSLIWTNLTVSLVHQANGQPDYFIAAIEDISARREAEAQARQNLLLLHAVVNGSIDSIFIKDLEGRYLLINPACAALFDKPAVQLIGKTDAEIFPAELLTPIRERDQQTLIGAEPVTFEEQVPTAAGIKTFLTTKRAVYDAMGDVFGVLGVARDITAQRQNETEREKLLAELSDRNAEMESFVYTISHDLKAPLITIGGFASLLAKDIAKQNQAAIDDSLTEINNATVLLQKHIHDLLLLSRIGRVQIEPSNVALVSLLQPLLASLVLRLAEASASVSLAEDLPTIRADQRGFYRVFSNLLDNAIKYRRANLPLQIDIGWQRDEHELRLFVRDNGSGIKKRFQARIFGLFQRADSKTEGTGVGLAITKRVIESHGGRIWVESEHDSGSIFWIALPGDLIVAAPVTSSIGLQT